MSTWHWEQLARRVPDRWTLTLYRVVPLDAGAPAYQRSGWQIVAGDPLRWTETVQMWWGPTPDAALRAALA